MTTLELLKAARETISTPDKWTQYAIAKNTSGEIRSADESDAVCFCMLGAIWKNSRQSGSAEGELKNTINGRSIAGFNDDPSRTHDEVLNVFDKTIARLEEAQ